MSKITLEDLTGDMLIAINRSVGGPGIGPGNPDSALSSWYYYEGVQEQIASVVSAIIKNHSFSDANKRTGTAVLFLLAESYGIKMIECDALFDAILEIAKGHYDAETVAKMLFGSGLTATIVARFIFE